MGRSKEEGENDGCYGGKEGGNEGGGGVGGGAWSRRIGSGDTVHGGECYEHEDHQGSCQHLHLHGLHCFFKRKIIKRYIVDVCMYVLMYIEKERGSAISI